MSPSQSLSSASQISVAPGWVLLSSSSQSSCERLRPVATVHASSAEPASSPYVSPSRSGYVTIVSENNVGFSSEQSSAGSTLLATPAKSSQRPVGELAVSVGKRRWWSLSASTQQISVPSQS